MKVCFHHEQFDADISSGTIHALHQWYELFNAFGVTECAIINTAGTTIPVISTSIPHTAYPTMAAFLEAQAAQSPAPKLTFVEHGGTPFTTFDFTDTDWLVFGGSTGLPTADVGIPTGTVALYPREAAAIILAAITCR